MTTPPKLIQPQAKNFYLLSAPLFLTELVFLAIYLANIDQAVSSFQAIIPIDFLSGALTTIALVLPELIIIGSVYAFVKFRVAMMISLLTIFFLVNTSILGTVDPYLSDLVVASAFASLIGFSYARSAKILKGPKAILASDGPKLLKATTGGFDLVLPFAAALGVTALVAYVMGQVRLQVELLPQPLSSLGTLYLQSHFYLVMTILTIAGGAIWAIRALIEPIILRLTLTRADAREMAFGEIRDTYWGILIAAYRKPSRGLEPLVIFTTILALLVIILVIAAGPTQSANYLLTALGLIRAVPSQAELLTGNVMENLNRSVNQGFVAFSNILNFLIRLLWG